VSRQWNPLHDLMLLQDRMNRLFEDATGRRANVETEQSEMENVEWYPAADFYDMDGKYLIALDLPGIDRSALEINIDDNKLAIRGTRGVSKTSPTRSERPTGRFLRTFNVPSSVDQQKIQAEYKDGVLEIQLPKRAEQQAKRIEIKVS
jgi:HSP20 family protein